MPGRFEFKSSTAIDLCPRCGSVAEPKSLLPVPASVRANARELAKYGYELVEKHFPKATLPLRRIALTVGAVRHIAKNWEGGTVRRCTNARCLHEFT